MWELVPWYVVAYNTQMMSEKNGPLEQGDREASYVLELENGSDLYYPTDLDDAWEKRQDLLNTPRVDDVYLIREDRTVIPPDARADHYGVVDVSEVHEALNAARAIMLGEAAEVDSLRPHRHPHLYDVTEGLRHRARLTAEAMERLETDGPPRADGSGGVEEKDPIAYRKEGSANTTPIFCPDCEPSTEDGPWGGVITTPLYSGDLTNFRELSCVDCDTPILRDGEPVDGTEGLHGKYTVLKDGEEQTGCFVLKPEDDPAAMEALRTYALHTENDQLERDLTEWLEQIRSENDD